MKKIVLLPMDERPCNYKFPKRLFENEEIQIIEPERLGFKKDGADYQAIKEFLCKECKDAYGLIISMDMLLYGGLIPSRIHHQDEESLMKKLETIKELRKENPNLKIFAFQCIMRCPSYSSSDEEPDYYENYGKQIHDLGEAVNMHQIGISQGQRISELTKEIPEEYIEDFISRREINRQMNMNVIDLLQEGYLDSLVIPQDDSTTYGYPAMDQKVIREKIQELGLIDKVLIYPGADEVELTLFARMLNTIKGECPKVYVKYACEKSKQIVPLYEGFPLDSTVSYHILSAGCQQTFSFEQADIILALSAPSENMEEAEYQPSIHTSYSIDRNLAEFLRFIKMRLAEGKVVSIADNAYANGADLSLIQLLNTNGLLLKVSGYAGWNTSANTIGTAIAEAVNYLYYGQSQNQMDFIVQRYLEDAGYCARVRTHVKNHLPAGMNYFDVNEKDGVVSQMVHKQLQEFAEHYLSSIASEIRIMDVKMPWKRMFEVDLDARWQESEK